MRVLVVDDDANLVRVVRQSLEPDGHVVWGAQDAHEGLTLVQSWHPDLIMLDIVMPEMDGRELCRRVRQISQAPIIFLTGLGDEMDIVSAFSAGADEYLIKPPRSNELRARVRALLRWGRLSASDRNYYDDGYLTVDVPARRVQKQGHPLQLSPIEFRLLSYLLARRGQLISHQELIEAVWVTAQGKSTVLLHLYIRHLRIKLEPEPNHPRYLLNRFGEGYWFEPHDAPASDVGPHSTRSQD